MNTANVSLFDILVEGVFFMHIRKRYGILRIGCIEHPARKALSLLKRSLKFAENET